MFGKKPERPRRRVRKIDEYVIDYAGQDVSEKVVNVKSVKKCSPGEEGGGGGGGGGGTLPTAHKNTRVSRRIASGEGTSKNRLWGPRPTA